MIAPGSWVHCPTCACAVTRRPATGLYLCERCTALWRIENVADEYDRLRRLTQQLQAKAAADLADRLLADVTPPAPRQCTHPRAVPVKGRGWVCPDCGHHLTGE